MRSLLLTLLVASPLAANAAVGHGRRGKDCEEGKASPSPPPQENRPAHGHGHKHAHTRTITHYETATAGAGAGAGDGAGYQVETSSALAVTGGPSPSTTFVVVPSSSAAPAQPPQDTTCTEEEGAGPTGAPPQTTSSAAAVQPTETEAYSTSAAKPTETHETQTYTPTAVQPTETHETQTYHPTTTQQPTKETSTEQAPTSTHNGGGGGGGDAYASATEVPASEGPTKQCGTNDMLHLDDMPFFVSNNLYHSGQMKGTQCTDFDAVLETADEAKTPLVRWTSRTDVVKEEQYIDLCKGFSNIGAAQNTKVRLSEVKSIPTYFQWDREVHGEAGSFRGGNVFDLMVAPQEGDTTSTDSVEFMLFLQTWGDQRPIAWNKPPVATPTMFGTTWKVYEGKNEGNGVTVRSMMPDTDMGGRFQGDLKEWVDFIVEQGWASTGLYLNALTAGSEIFWGSATMEATVGLSIEVNSGEHEYN